MKNHHALLKKIDAQKKEWEAEVKHLQAKSERLEANARVEYQHKLDEIKEWLKEAERKAHQLKDETEESWHDTGKKVEDAWNNLVTKIDKAILKLKK
jgi:DNA repair ATPase RecN